jgi:small-conductance mechanosensitive channel
MSETLFELGPYKVCMWNLLALTAIYSMAFILSRLIHKSLKKYLIDNNIKLEGRKTTMLKLSSQSVYFLAAYISILSFKINNNNVSFTDFLNYKIVESKQASISFFQIIIVIGVFFAARISVNFMKLYYNKKLRQKESFNPSTEYIYVQTTKYAIYIFSILFSLNLFEINISLLLTGSAAMLAVIGFIFQDVFKDMFSGLVLLFEGTIKIGDIVEIRDSKFKEPVFAKILKINVRSTQIETREGNVFIIPNAKLTQEYVENWSQNNELTRSTILVTVQYGTDSDLVINLLKQAALSHPKVKKNNPIQVRLRHFGENGLEMELLFWCDNTWDINNYKSEIRLEINRLFIQYNIKIPYPHRHIVYDKPTESENKNSTDYENSI